MESEEGRERPRGPDWERHQPLGAIVLTMLAVLAWLIFILLFALYWSSGFSLFQNVIVGIVSLGITAIVIGLGWVIWGMKFAKPWMNPR
jgi:hypothetical protein